MKQEEITRREFVHFRSTIDTSRSRTRRMQFIIFNFIKKVLFYQNNFKLCAVKKRNFELKNFFHWLKKNKVSLNPILNGLFYGHFMNRGGGGGGGGGGGCKNYPYPFPPAPPILTSDREKVGS